MTQGSTLQTAQNEQKEVKVLNFDQLQPYLHRSDDTVYLVNFWATWCVPCRKEMPAIMAVEEKYRENNFKVLLVSLDFPGQLESSLKPYLINHNIRSEVILLDDPDQNRWINQVDPNWSGDIPFTLIYGKNFRESHAGALSFETLDSIINSKINSP
ncbi:MAG: TlpA family protein disulfide reductase [Bacteroidales bacterium]|jgi:thiol-disulfide isomerase/thioredoxin|nr:TlpA family protein disulfide reductase [Bacteroidales bacterium]